MELDYHDEKGAAPVAPDRWLRALEAAGLWISAAAVVVLGVLIIASIIGRATIGRTIPDDNIMVADLMVGIVALSWAAVTATRGNIVVEVFTNWVGDRGQAGLRALGSLVGLGMIAPLAWASGNMAAHAIQKGTFYDGLLMLPQWPARCLFFYAFAAMTLRLLILLWTDLRAVARGGVRDTSGTD